MSSRLSSIGRTMKDSPVILEPDKDTISQKELQPGVLEAIATLRNLLQKEKSLRVRTDDRFLLRYLWCSEFDPIQAFERIKDWYQLKHMYPDWFPAGSLSDYEEILDSCIGVMLPHRNCTGYRIYLCRLGCISPNKHSPQLLSQLDDLWIETVLDEPITQSCGLAIIVDMAGYSAKILKWLVADNIKVSAMKTEKYPVKDMQIHVINLGIILDIAIKLIYPFLSDKTKSNIHFHRNLESLHKYFDPKVLPPEYRGNLVVDHSSLKEQFVLQKWSALEESFELGYSIHGPLI